MDPHDFIDKWRDAALTERASSQSHFNDLCRLLNIEEPVSADPEGSWFTFEKGATKTTGGKGWADVWRRGCFGWEYKGPGRDLDAAFAQLQRYAVALENPPLLIVSDIARIRVHTNWTNTVQEVTQFTLDDLRDGANRDRLRSAFTDPEAWKPRRTRQRLTEEAAERFAGLATRLRDRGHDAQTVAHFVNRLVFCLFAEDVGLLPGRMFQKMLEACEHKPGEFAGHARTLFTAMKDGGLVGFERVPWFNGGLFDDDTALALERADIADLLKAARLDWSGIDPSILGTLFERGLDPDKRSQLGAHYTDRDKIMQLVEPVVRAPLLGEWEATHARIRELLDNAPRDTAEHLRSSAEIARATRAWNEARRLKAGFSERLRNFRVLDPACGSGNFLNLALTTLKDVEHRANLDCEALGFERSAPVTGPENMLGIELNPYAAELARVSVWIGEIQWMRRNGLDASRNPVLRPLENIECRDAVLAPDGTRADWPDADAVVGNPPFVGAKLMKRRLGHEYTVTLRNAYADNLPGFSDLVCYWFERARQLISEKKLIRAGLVATKAIAKNTNLPVLKSIHKEMTIFEAHTNEPWIVDGAAVRVALVCFSDQVGSNGEVRLNGEKVESINPDLTSGLNKTATKILPENRNVVFVGIQKSGPFEVAGQLARKWLTMPLNPNGRSNADVLRPTLGGHAITQGRQDAWLIDFPRGISEADASLWEAPFTYLDTALYDPDQPSFGLLKEFRQGVRDWQPKEQWWTTYWPRPDVRAKLANLSRYLVTPMTSEHRVFIWERLPLIPDNNTIIIARDDDASFGIIHSCFHEIWSTLIGNKMGVGNQRRYNPDTVFQTFPFPEGLTPDIPAADYADDPRAQAIATAAARLNELRENWLNPPDLVDRVPEVVPGYPDRILPKDDAAAAVLKKRTLTNLYNARPGWLDHAHRDLDAAVADAYGWGEDWRAGRLDDDEILARLFALNQARAQSPAKGSPARSPAR